MRYSDNTEEVDRECAGYIPDDEQYEESDNADDESSPVMYGNDAAGTDIGYTFNVFVLTISAYVGVTIIGDDADPDEAESSECEYGKIYEVNLN